MRNARLDDSQGETNNIVTVKSLKGRKKLPFCMQTDDNNRFGVTRAAAAKSLQSCPTQRDPIDGSPPGSPVPGILQARTLEWVAISFSNA